MAWDLQLLELITYKIMRKVIKSLNTTREYLYIITSI